jgi:predicted O-linked N-acetylglucosamine transferase (SPINDLY family)
MGGVPELAEENLRNIAAEEGIEQGRLIFAKLEPRKDEHLRRLQLVDLGLDTLVFNGQTTTKDLLWAGVPVVAYYGRHFSSRVSASLLWALGMDDHLVARSLEDYEKMALNLARDSEKLASLRQYLDGARFSSSLFDMPKMVRQMEGLYSEMVRRDNAGEVANALFSV